MALTFIIVTLGWALFRIDDLSLCVLFVSHLFSFNMGSASIDLSAEFITILTVALFFSFITLLPIGKRVGRLFFHTQQSSSQTIFVWVISMALFVMSLATLTAVDFSPFIYFRF